MICRSAAARTTPAVPAVVAGGLGSGDGAKEEIADQRFLLIVFMAETRLLKLDEPSSSLTCEARWLGFIGTMVEPSSSKGPSWTSAVTAGVASSSAFGKTRVAEGSTGSGGK